MLLDSESKPSEGPIPSKKTGKGPQTDTCFGGTSKTHSCLYIFFPSLLCSACIYQIFSNCNKSQVLLTSDQGFRETIILNLFLVTGAGPAACLPAADLLRHELWVPRHPYSTTQVTHANLIMKNSILGL
jgi:hypothetical protein